MTESRDHELELRRILDGVVESIVDAPEEEIDADLRASGIHPDVAAEGLLEKLEQTVERHRARRHSRASVTIQKNLLMMKVQPFELPETAKERMRLLGAVLHRKPELKEKLPVQVEDLESLPDEEVSTCLRRLADAGALDDPPGGDK